MTSIPNTGHRVLPDSRYHLDTYGIALEDRRYVSYPANHQGILDMGAAYPTLKHHLHHYLTPAINEVDILVVEPHSLAPISATNALELRSYLQPFFEQYDAQICNSNFTFFDNRWFACEAVALKDNLVERYHMMYFTSIPTHMSIQPIFHQHAPGMVTYKLGFDEQ